MTEERKSCILCACKHLAQARVLLQETRAGYAEHFWYALGHLAEAEAEVIDEHPGVAEALRAERKQLELYPRHVVPFKEMILNLALLGNYDVEVLLTKGPLVVEGDRE